MTVLIVEDDKKIRDELSKLLISQGYDTYLIDDFSDVFSEIMKIDADIILLDVNLFDEDGFSVCKKIRKERNIPVIFVTCRNTLEDELMSIQSGGIDFITKPYNKSILLEKIKRAICTVDPMKYKEITKKGCTLDLHLSLLKFNGKEIELTRNEFKILYYFFTNQSRVITKDEIIEYLWNDKYYLDENILIVNINRLRKKAEEIGISDLIVTVRGKGYML